MRVSFEVFPPKTEAGLDQLSRTAEALRAVDPVYVSVTYGAGGSDHVRSYDAIRTVVATGVRVAGHLTCVGQPVHDIDRVIDRYAELGVDQIVALRGDPAEGIDAPYRPHPEGYQRTADLVAAAKAHDRFEVSVSGYPERHPQSPTDDHDLAVLAEKVEAGADRAMTQMFFDNDLFVRYVDRVRAAGIEIPIVPGIFPIHCIDSVMRFAARCGAGMPQRIVDRFAGVDDPETRTAIGADVAAEQILGLAAEGVDHVHVYTLNRPDLALAVCERIGVTPDTLSTTEATS